MKKYLAFFGSVYYPSGGMGDFIGDYDTPKQAKSAINAKCKEGMIYDTLDKEWDCKWAHVYNTLTKKIIWKK